MVFPVESVSDILVYSNMLFSAVFPSHLPTLHLRIYLDIGRRYCFARQAMRHAQVSVLLDDLHCQRMRIVRDRPRDSGPGEFEYNICVVELCGKWYTNDVCIASSSGDTNHRKIIIVRGQGSHDGFRDWRLRQGVCLTVVRDDERVTAHIFSADEWTNGEYHLNVHDIVADR